MQQYKDFDKKLSYSWQTAQCRFVKLLGYCRTFVRIRSQEVHQRLQCDSVPFYLQQFPSYTMLKSMRKSKNLYFYNIFVSPGDAPVAITQNVSQMKRQFSACQTPRSMYPSIFNSFPVIRTASAKNRRFHVPQPTFLFPLETPLRLSRNMLRGWKDNSVLAKPITACTHLSAPSSSPTILFFPHQTGWQYSDGDPPNGGVEWTGAWKKSRFSTNISLYFANDAR